jgi:hypothetical protein
MCIVFSSSALLPVPDRISQLILSPLLSVNLALELAHVPLNPLDRALQGVNVLGEQLVADAVLVDDVVVHGGAGGCSACEKAEEPAACRVSFGAGVGAGVGRLCAGGVVQWGRQGVHVMASWFGA